MVNQITQVRMPDGTPVPLVDWSSRPLYSTVDLLTGFTDEEIRAFSYTESEQVSCSNNLPAASRRTASLRDTNIANASEMDATEEFLVYAISVEVHQWCHDEQNGLFNAATVQGLPYPMAPIMSLLHARLILELEVSQKAFPQAGLGYFAQGFGPTVATTGSDDAIVRTFSNNGIQGADAIDFMPVPTHLGGTEDYSVIIHNPPNGPDDGGTGAVTFPNDTAGDLAYAVIQLRIYLRGLHKRPTG